MYYAVIMLFLGADAFLLPRLLADDQPLTPTTVNGLLIFVVMTCLGLVGWMFKSLIQVNSEHAKAKEELAKAWTESTKLAQRMLDQCVHNKPICESERK